MFDIKSTIKLLKGRKKTIGCDVGAMSVKFVMLEEASTNKFKLLNMGRVVFPDASDRDGMVALIRQFMHDNDFLPDGYAAVNIEDPSLFIRRMILPKMPERDMKTAIRWNFREFVDGSVDEYIISYSEIKGFAEAGKINVSAFCVHRDAVEGIYSFLRDAGLKTFSVEPNATALLAAFDYNIGWEPGKYCALLDLGDSISNFVVGGNGCLMFSRPLKNLNGLKLVEVVSKDLSLERDKARAVLRQFVDKNMGGKVTEETVSADVEAQVAKTVSHFISQIVVDVQRSIDAFCLMFRREKIDKIYLCGGGIYLPNIVERFSSGLGVEVEVFNPFSKIVDAEDAIASREASLYAVAVGLAIPVE